MFYKQSWRGGESLVRNKKEHPLPPPKASERWVFGNVMGAKNLVELVEKTNSSDGSLTYIYKGVPERVTTVKFYYYMYIF